MTWYHASVYSILSGLDMICASIQIVEGRSIKDLTPYLILTSSTSPQPSRPSWPWTTGASTWCPNSTTTPSPTWRCGSEGLSPWAETRPNTAKNRATGAWNSGCGISSDHIEFNNELPQRKKKAFGLSGQRTVPRWAGADRVSPSRLSGMQRTVCVVSAYVEGPRWIAGYPSHTGILSGVSSSAQQDPGECIGHSGRDRPLCLHQCHIYGI